MLYDQIFRSFQDLKLRYLVVGGIAVNLHGFTRATYDLDILIDMDDANVAKFIRVIQKLAWKPKIPVPLTAFADPAQRKAWIQEKKMIVFAVYNPKQEMEHLDVLLNFSRDFEKFYKGKKNVTAQGIEIPLLSIPDLITLKKKAGRDRDQIDIRALQEILKIQNEEAKKKKES